MDVDQAVRALAGAHVALDAGDADNANRLARDVLCDAEAAGESCVQAKALALLAHSDRLTSRFRSALDSSQRAAFLFRICGDVTGEVGALATQSHAASSLGRNEEAVEAGLLAVHLANQFHALPQLAISYNNLGVAYFWSRDFENASMSLSRAVVLADQCGSKVVAIHPRLNRVCAETLRLITHRFHLGTLPDAKHILEWMNFCSPIAGEDTFAGLAEGMRASLKSLQILFVALAKCWSGDLVGASADADSGLAWANRFPTMTWLHAFERLVRTEISWAQGELQDALRFAREWLALSAQIEHEQLACLAHLVISQLYELQGHHIEAVAELKTLRLREERIRIDSLQSRSRVVAWQIDIRQNEKRLSALQTSSQKFERLSNEDPLTGLGNRRFFEDQAKELMASCASLSQPVCVALLDVDSFKQVNDKFSHSVGDQVLKVIGDVMRQCSRELDLPARLAGDEFVIFLPNATATVAAQVCMRVRASVEAFDWESVAPGLRVTVSTGSVQAQSDETFESLLHRSDLSMYAAKGT
jgi:diguanylate cyclase (GGDEF)-like protein